MAGSGNPEPVERLIEQLTRLPGIGRRSAERIAFHVLKADRTEAERIARSILDVKDNVRHCRICYNLTDVDPCRICAAENRAAEQVLVVEQPRDVIGLEQAGLYKGVYHVLTGQLDPLAGVGPEDLTVGALMERVRHPERNARGVAVEEVILGLNPTMEGDSTTLYLVQRLRAEGVRVTRLARGLPAGSQLEYASAAVLADAIEGRRAVE